ncbi:MAG: GNAT family N-acetyltransferase [Candidatus Micrarchaeota archaeon]|nr:GNAT family N-acetyltransferase [Candidatus Micrarchaeota archaeon]
MRIRSMRIGDFNAMYKVWKRAGLDLNGIADERYEAGEMLRINPKTCFVAVEKGVVGTIFGVYNGRRAWIHHLAVDPAMQGKGVGTALLRRAENALKGEGARKVLLFVNHTNRKVKSFYMKQGYEEPNEAVWMRKVLA